MPADLFPPPSIGAAKGKQPDTEALCQPPTPAPTPTRPVGPRPKQSRGRAWPNGASSSECPPADDR